MPAKSPTIVRLWAIEARALLETIQSI